jgi:hypothetical protein
LVNSLNRRSVIFGGISFLALFGRAEASQKSWYIGRIPDKPFDIPLVDKTRCSPAAPSANGAVSRQGTPRDNPDQQARTLPVLCRRCRQGDPLWDCSRPGRTEMEWRGNSWTKSQMADLDSYRQHATPQSELTAARPRRPKQSSRGTGAVSVSQWQGYALSHSWDQ